MQTQDVLIIGAGPAGLTAATECARVGCTTLLVDANLSPGGQLVKQTHRFFGSGTHMAGIRGIDIATELTTAAQAAGVRLWLDSSVHTLTPEGRVEILRRRLAGAARAGAMHNEGVTARKIILATGAEERAVAFPGWTLPGVMGAGAAQTMVNLHRVLPGRRVLMVGSGNVGLIVAYQLLQAGAEVLAVIEAAPEVGGYGVHASKLRRAGVPILTSHSVVAAHGERRVRAATVAEVDRQWRAIPKSARELAVDAICVAGGMRPATRLANMAGCRLAFDGSLGGWMPLHDSNMLTTHPHIYVAGDAGGVEEASVAMDEGRLAGLSVAASLGAPHRVGSEALVRRRLSSLRRDGPDLGTRGAAPGPGTECGAKLEDGPGARRNEPGGSPIQDDVIVCRCEEVTAGEVRRAIRQGAVTISGIKRRTRAGMGLCQGRSCGALVAAILSAELSQAPDQFSPDTVRPPSVPVTFGVLAGDRTC